MLHPAALNEKGLPVTVRTVYVIGPDKKLKLSLTYPPSTGRNFDEVRCVCGATDRVAPYSRRGPMMGS